MVRVVAKPKTAESGEREGWSMKSLFGEEIPDRDEPGPKRVARTGPAGETCGTCRHGIRPHDYRPDWIYCKVRPSKRTQFGIEKVRSRLAACGAWQGREQQQKGG